MKGSTHAIVGIAIGSAVALTHQMSFADGAVCVSVGALSALSADLDGQGMLANKLSKTSQAIHRTMIGLGMLFALWGFVQHFVLHYFDPWAWAASAAILMLAAVLKVGLIRNLMLSGIGIILVLSGWLNHMIWLAGLGCFVTCAPWFKHRGFTHTIWCNIGWAAIGWNMEQDIGISGLAISAGGGYLSHLLLDTMTPSGIKWFYPLVKKTIRFR